MTPFPYPLGRQCCPPPIFRHFPRPFILQAISDRICKSAKLHTPCHYNLCRVLRIRSFLVTRPFCPLLPALSPLFPTLASWTTTPKRRRLSAPCRSNSKCLRQLSNYLELREAEEGFRGPPSRMNPTFITEGVRVVRVISKELTLIELLGNVIHRKHHRYVIFVQYKVNMIKKRKRCPNGCV